MISEIKINYSSDKIEFISYLQDSMLKGLPVPINLGVYSEQVIVFDYSLEKMENFDMVYTFYFKKAD